MSNKPNRDGHQILLCDMGGTHARFARMTASGYYADFKKYRLDAFQSFNDIVRAYCEDTGAIFDAARFAVARTPVNGVISYKRFAGDPDYHIDFNEMESVFGWNDVQYFNDLEAGAYGTMALTDAQKRCVITASGQSRYGGQTLISVGTGVGHACIRNGTVFPTHGGHMLPVTASDEHRAFADFIRMGKDADLSLIIEDFVSARGLLTAYQFISGDQSDKEGEALFECLASNREAVRLFFEFLGIHAHMIVSCTGFYGNVFLAGGVIDQLVHYGLCDWSAFEKYFRPAMVSVVKDSLNATSVDYVLHDELPLLGLTVVGANDA